jgi:nitrite reductase (NADH) small subunit
MSGDGWVEICAVDDIPVLGSRVVTRRDGGNIAIFRNTADRIFALLDRCPHKGGPLSQGIVFGERVACPLHNWSIGLVDGAAVAPDEGCTTAYTVRVDAGRVYLDAAELRDPGHTAAPEMPVNALTGFVR